jgi:hypothetical protein
VKLISKLQNLVVLWLVLIDKSIPESNEEFDPVVHCFCDKFEVQSQHYLRLEVKDFVQTEVFPWCSLVFTDFEGKDS